eukprot:8862654-Alexandrium_andersonii.AAC.1
MFMLAILHISCRRRPNLPTKEAGGRARGASHGGPRSVDAAQDLASRAAPSAGRLMSKAGLGA